MSATLVLSRAARSGVVRAGVSVALLLATAAGLRGDDPVRLIDGHVDLRLRYLDDAAHPLDVVAADDDARPPRFLDSTNCVLIVAEPARLDLPADLPPLGLAGDPIWVLPASQRVGLLYLGLSAEGIPDGVLAEPVRLRLLQVEGPGSFFLWQAGLGGLEFFMNTRDGVSADDACAEPVGGHTHANWGFSTNGLYHLTFQAESRRVGESTNVMSAPRTFTFEVLPLPPPPESPYRNWLNRYWPAVSDATVIGEDADPDGDGQPNLWEYALGTDPTTPEHVRPSVLSITTSHDGQNRHVEIQLTRATTAVDLEFRLQTAERVTGPWVTMEVAPRLSDLGTGRTLLVFPDAPAPGSDSRRFYRVEARLAARN